MQLQAGIEQNYINDNGKLKAIDDAYAAKLKQYQDDYKQAEKDFSDWKKRAYTGEALQLLSGLVPMGTVGNLAVRGLVSGLAGGAIEGFGRGLVEDRNPLQTAAYDAAIGGLTGGAIGKAAPYVNKNVVVPFQRKMRAGINPFSRTNREVLADSSNQLHRLQADLINKYNPAPDDYHTWIRNADDIYTFEDTLKPPQFDPDFIGNDFDPSYTWDMAQDAIKNGEMEVFSSYPIEKGTFVTPSQMEAQSYAGNGNIYSKKVPLKDVAWIDQSQGQYAPIDKEYMEAVMADAKNNIKRLSKQDYRKLGKMYYANEFMPEGIEKDAYGHIKYSNFNKGKDDIQSIKYYPTMKEQIKTSKLGQNTNDKFEEDRTYDHLLNTLDGENLDYIIEKMNDGRKYYKTIRNLDNKK